MQARVLDRYLLPIVILGLALALGPGCGGDDKLRVNRVSPDKGIPGQVMIIYGSGFQSGGHRDASVFFEGRPAKVQRIKGDNELYVEVPGGFDPGKTVDILVRFEPGGEITYPKAFTYIEDERNTVNDLLQNKPEADSAK